MLRGVKFGVPIEDTAQSLPDYLLYPFLENKYRNNKDKIKDILKKGKKFSLFEKAIAWRDI